MKKTILLLLLITIVLLSIFMMSVYAAVYNITLSPIADAEYDTITATDGTETILGISEDNPDFPNVETSYLKFNISSVKSLSIINATLILTHNLSDSGDINISLHESNSTTWNDTAFSAPGYNETELYKVVDNGTENAILSINMSTMINSDKNDIISVTLVGDTAADTAVYKQYHSRESPETTKRPRLIIYYFSNTAPTITLNNPTGNVSLDAGNATNYKFNATITDFEGNISDCSFIYNGQKVENYTGVANNTVLNHTRNITETTPTPWYWSCNDSATDITNSTTYYASRNPTAPVVNLISPDDDSTQADPVEFNASCSNNLGQNMNATLWINGISNETIVVGNGTNFTFNKTLGDGVFNWTIQCDYLGLYTNATQRNLTIKNNQAPILILGTPDNNFTVIYLNYTNYKFNATYVDLDNDVGNCSFIYNNTIAESFMNVENGTILNHTQNITQHSNYGWYWSCTDGKVVTNSTVYYAIYQDTKPTFDQALTSNKFASTAIPLLYDINCTDLDNDTITYQDNTSLFDINSTTGLITDVPVSGEDGIYNINITCYTPYGSNSSIFQYTIDASTTSTVYNHQAELSTGIMVINASCSENGTSILYINGMKYANNTVVANVTFNYTYVNYTEGLYEYSVECTDMYGNKANNTPELCYQETANATHISDGTCGLSTEGSYVTAANYIYIYYTKPSFDTATGNLWRISHGSVNTNVTIPSDCWNYTSDELYLRMYSYRNMVFSNSSAECYNGTDWKILSYTSSSDVMGFAMSSDMPELAYDGIWTQTYLPSGWISSVCYETGIWNNNGLNNDNSLPECMLTEEGMYWAQEIMYFRIYNNMSPVLFNDTVAQPTPYSATVCVQVNDTDLSRVEMTYNRTMGLITQQYEVNMTQVAGAPTYLYCYTFDSTSLDATYRIFNFTGIDLFNNKGYLNSTLNFTILYPSTQGGGGGGNIVETIEETIEEAPKAKTNWWTTMSIWATDLYDNLSPEARKGYLALLLIIIAIVVLSLLYLPPITFRRVR